MKEGRPRKRGGLVLEEVDNLVVSLGSPSFLTGKLRFFFLLNYYPFPEVLAAHESSHCQVNCNNALCDYVNLVIICGKRYMVLSAKETPERESAA